MAVRAGGGPGDVETKLAGFRSDFPRLKADPEALPFLLPAPAWSPKLWGIGRNASARPMSGIWRSPLTQAVRKSLDRCMGSLESTLCLAQCCTAPCLTRRVRRRVVKEEAIKIARTRGNASGARA